MSQPRVLREAFGKPLKSAGFKKKRGDTWYLENDETIVVVNLQKSDYGRQYYVNLAVWLKALGDAETPPEHHCQVRLRWEDVIPDEGDKLPERLLDLENTTISDDRRIIESGRLLQEYILPFLSKVSSLAGLRSLYQTNALPKSCGVYADAQKLLSQKGTAQ